MGNGGLLWTDYSRPQGVARTLVVTHSEAAIMHWLSPGYPQHGWQLPARDPQSYPQSVDVSKGIDAVVEQVPAGDGVADTTSAGLVTDAVGQLGDLVVDRPALRHQMADLTVGVHDRRVVAATELLADLG